MRVDFNILSVMSLFMSCCDDTHTKSVNKLPNLRNRYVYPNEFVADILIYLIIIITISKEFMKFKLCIWNCSNGKSVVIIFHAFEHGSRCDSD